MDWQKVIGILAALNFPGMVQSMDRFRRKKGLFMRTFFRTADPAFLKSMALPN